MTDQLDLDDWPLRKAHRADPVTSRAAFWSDKGRGS